MTLKPCEPKVYGEHCTGQPSVVYSEPYWPEPLVQSLLMSVRIFSRWLVTGAELQLIEEPEPHIVLAVQGEGRDLIVH